MGNCGSSVAPDPAETEVKQTPAAAPATNEPPPKTEEKEAKVVEAIKHHRAKKNILFGDSLPEESNFSKKIVDKSDSDREFLRKALSEHFLFTALDSEEANDVINAMEKQEIMPGDNCITQGENGDYFYFVQSGHFDCYVDDSKVCEYNSGDGFGELALLYNAPRAATCQSTVKSVVWKLDRQTFRHTLAFNAQKNIQSSKNAIKHVTLLESLSDFQISQIAQAVQIVQFKAGETIITKGEEGQVFYMIKEGNVTCQNIGEENAELELKPGDYFGERALLLDEPRAATVVCKSDVILMALDREAFNELIGPLTDLLENNIAIYILKALPQLSHLLNEERQQIINGIKSKNYNKDEILCKEGDLAEAFYVVKEGKLKCEYSDGHSPKTINRGEYFNENIFVCEEKNLGSLIAEEDSVVLYVDKQTLNSIGNGSSSVINLAQRRKSASLDGGVDPILKNASLSDFEQLRTLGTGSFGRVKLVKFKQNNEVYALKCLKKKQIIALHQEKNIMNEKRILMQCRHPFIQRLYSTYKDENCLYMLIEFIQGGELFTLLWNFGGTVSSKTAQFYAGCVLSGLSYLHDQNIIYRDLKPENLMVDKDGFVKIVDFGFAKEVQDKTYTLCGTPEYLAPEIVVGKGHNKAVDYWALGVLIYEMLCGYSPFADREKNRQMQICKNIMRGQYSYPSHMQDEPAKDLIKRLLEPDPTKRFGCLKNGAMDIKRHEWFKKIDWISLESKDIQDIPWKPTITSEVDTSNFDDYRDENEQVEPFYGDSSWADDF